MKNLKICLGKISFNIILEIKQCEKLVSAENKLDFFKEQEV